MIQANTDIFAEISRKLEEVDFRENVTGSEYTQQMAWYHTILDISKIPDTTMWVFQREPRESSVRPFSHSLISACEWSMEVKILGPRDDGPIPTEDNKSQYEGFPESCSI